MEGVGEPDLLVRGAGSPHTYSMRPSEAAMLERADVVFWVGPDLEMFLSGALDHAGQQCDGRRTRARPTV
jgi:zinc transport system substrate-binding protein